MPRTIYLYHPERMTDGGFDTLIPVGTVEGWGVLDSPYPFGKKKKSLLSDFLRLLVLHVHREVSALVNEIPEEIGHFRFLHATCLANIKGSVGLILAKDSAMRISIPMDLSSRSFIPLYRAAFALGDLQHS